MASDIEDHPSWKGLRALLRDLCEQTAGSNAFVLDAWGNLWCSAHSDDRASLVKIVAFAESAIRAQKPALTRGGKLDRLVPHSNKAYMRSFAGVYVLYLALSKDSDPEAARQLAVAALPLIESLTLALPPPDGPGTSGNEGFGVA